MNLIVSILAAVLALTTTALAANSPYRLTTRNASMAPNYADPAIPAYVVPGFASSFRYGPFGADRAPITGGGY